MANVESLLELTIKYENSVVMIRKKYRTI